MKKRNLYMKGVVLSSCLLLTFLQCQSNDKINFIFNSKNTQYNISLTDFNKITFSNDLMHIHTLFEQPSTISYNDLWKITFDLSDTFIPSISLDSSELTISQNADEISICCNDNIESAYIYNLHGNLINSIHPNQNSSEISFKYDIAGIYIIKITTNTKSIVKKFIIK